MADVAPVLRFGRARSGEVPFDLETLLVSRLLVQANSGGGKSHAIRYLLEETYGRVQHIIIDRDGEFSSLREKFAYALVGRDGEVAADPRGAKLLARKLLELELSAVIDLSEMGLPQQRNYVALFLDALMHLPRELWKDCLIVIDEAHYFAQQRQRKGTTGDSIEAVELLLAGGRKRGFCAVLATQRLAKLDKDCAAECLNKLIGRTSSEDERRAGEELGLSKEEARALRALEPGSFWTYGPAVSPLDPILVRTGEELKTSIPKRGTLRAPAPPTPHAIAKVVAALKDLPQQADAEARTTAQLQREVTDLQAKLRKAEKGNGHGKGVPIVDESAAQRLVDRALAAAAKERAQVDARRVKIVRQIGGSLARVATQLSTVATSVTQAATDLEQFASLYGEPVAIATPSAVRPDPAPTRATAPRPAAPRERKERAPVEGEASLGKTPQRILNALRFYQSLGIDTPSRAQVSGLLGISWDTGTFRSYLSEVRTVGFIEDRTDGRISLTTAGAARAVDEFDAHTLAEIHNLWYRKLGKTPAAMLRIVVREYPNGVTRAAIARELGIEWDTGTFRSYLSELRTPGLIEDVSRTEVRASGMLFPEGLN